MGYTSLRQCLLAAALLTVASSGVLADTLSTQSRRLDSLAASRGETRVSNNIAADFTAFSGSPENANSLVQGLRSGSTITLTEPGALPGTGTSVSFVPPTRPMGYGNTFITLSLAQQQLAGMGIANPTPEQLQAALVGGTLATPGGTTTTSGILQMRADGMGWGQIANNLGYKLGNVVSGLKRANTAVLAQPATSGTGITSASGSALGLQQGKGHGHGIVSATGTAPGAMATGKGGKGQGSPISTGMGAGAGAASGVTSGMGNHAGGNGMGQARGHGKP